MGTDETLRLAPIVLFVYNRPRHTYETLRSLMRNDLADRSELIIYADGPTHDASEETRRRIREVRHFIRSEQWCRAVRICERERNRGLAGSVIEGVTEVVNQFGKVIVLEDDLLLARGFLKFMNGALEAYRDNRRIFSISGYRYPGVVPKAYRESVFLFPRASSWGWATWSDRWNKADWEVRDLERLLSDTEEQKRFHRGGSDLTEMLVMQAQGRIDSWAIRWCFVHHANHAYGLFPVRSLVQNIGLDGSGIHCGPSGKFFGVIEDDSGDAHFPAGLSADEQIIKNHAAFFDADSTNSGTSGPHAPRIGTLSKSLKRTLKKLVKRIVRSAGYDMVRVPAEVRVATIAPDEESKELARLRPLPRYTETTTSIFGRTFRILDAESFYWSYKEIFEKGIYRFRADSDTPLVIDGGANVGTSILFFKRIYPKGRVIAFEADPHVFAILKENIAHFALTDVTLHNKALWNAEEELFFMSEGADGGRLSNHLSDFPKVAVKAVRFSEFLMEPVDFLKLDIEGAEIEVLADCADRLGKVKNMFVEYHSFRKHDQRLDALLAILRAAGFRYQIQTQFSSPQPLIERIDQLGMDLQLNIFAYREG
jgi:FkbM family methyltransferase